MMHWTLLSLGRSDKADKPYLIGVFGQGGSSAFSVSEYSIVVTRRAKDIRKPGEDDGAGWSIVRAIQPKGRRDLYYSYLAAGEEGGVPRVTAAEADKAGFAQGAQFTHIKYDFGTADSAIARLMYPALNHVLFNPVLPYEPGVSPRWSLYQRRPGTLRHNRPSRSPLSVGRKYSVRPA